MEVIQKIRTGETWRCLDCGMEVRVTQGCECEGGCPSLTCCGKPLEKAGESPDAAA